MNDTCSGHGSRDIYSESTEQYWNNQDINANLSIECSLNILSMAAINVLPNVRNKEALIEEKYWEEIWRMSWTKYPKEKRNGEEKSNMWKYK